MSNEIKKTKAVAYARVSTLLEQDPANQTIPIQELTKAREFELVKTYIDLDISVAPDLIR